MNIDYSRRNEIKAQIEELKRQLVELDEGRCLNFKGLNNLSIGGARVCFGGIPNYFRKLVVSLYSAVKHEEYGYYDFEIKKVKELTSEQIANCNKCLSEMVDVYLKYLNEILD